MSKVAALKKKAADLEKKSPDKAIAMYVELVAEMEKHPEELDVAILNRIGDLLVKQGNVGEAVNYYEQAVDNYVDGGFLNNAIALCNKILRSSPGRATVYYKLGKISAHKGFKADAKQNFLEYADRMQKAGKLDEAFRALAEFADLCPDQTDIRLMLAEQLSKAGKKAEAVEQFQLLHEQLESEGNTSEAAAAVERMKAIDPTAEPRSGGGPRSDQGSSDLVFIDLSDSPKAAQARRSTMMKRATSAGMKAIDPSSKITPPKSAEPQAAAPAPAPPPAPPVAETPATVEPEPSVDGGQMLGLETTSLSDTAAPIDSGAALEIESASLLELPSSDEASEPGATLDFVMPGADDASVGTEPEPAAVPMIEESLIMPDAADSLTVPPTPAPVEELSLVDAALDLSMPGDELPPAGRPSTLMTAKSLDMLQAIVDKDPDDWGGHRELAESLLEAGNREAGIRELETAMLGFERSGDLSSAMSVADEIVRIDPSSVKHHQKRVEYAYRTSDRGQLVESYLALADALFRGGQVDKSRTIYQRVLELSPDDDRAQAALGSMPEPVSDTPAAKSPAAKKQTPQTPARLESVKPTPIGDDAFVNLGDWLRDEEEPKDTRMVVAEEEPTGNEEADFADMLKKFKQGVAENVEAEDYQSHYDLGVAFKEMGLIDEAIAEFQKALRGTENRVRTYEAIGQCFIEKGQDQMAATVLGRALGEKGMGDDQLIGVLYLLGRANEALGKTDDALVFYQRVFVVDIQFHDVGERLSALENAPR